MRLETRPLPSCMRPLSSPCLLCKPHFPVPHSPSSTLSPPPPAAAEITELDEEQQACNIDAMSERRVEAGEVVIRWGRVGTVSTVGRRGGARRGDPLPASNGPAVRLLLSGRARREGEEGDNLYVVEAGTFEATKAPPPAARTAGVDADADASATPVVVASYPGRGCFGELALMYNCPRAATVTGGWALCCAVPARAGQGGEECSASASVAC